MSEVREGHRVLGKRRWDGAILLLAAALGVMGILGLANGFALGWRPDMSRDLLERFQEYQVFLQRVYPHPEISADRAIEGMRSSVYFPYAFPMLALLFGGGNWLAGRFLIGVIAVVSLLFLGWFSYRELRFAGRPMAWLGAVTALAINSNSPILTMGQFSSGCTALLVLQLELLRRNRSLAAGGCWALAMIKPQIALPFALLFAWRGQWRGLALGAGVLLALTLFTCAWTEVSPWRIASHWLMRDRMAYTQGNIGLLQSSLFDGLLTPRTIQLLLAGAAFLLLALLARWLTTQRDAVDPLVLAGLCACIGRLSLLSPQFRQHHAVPGAVGPVRSGDPKGWAHGERSGGSAGSPALDAQQSQRPCSAPGLDLQSDLGVCGSHPAAGIDRRRDSPSTPQHQRVGNVLVLCAYTNEVVTALPCSAECAWNDFAGVERSLS